MWKMASKVKSKYRCLPEPTPEFGGILRQRLGRILTSQSSFWAFRSPVLCPEDPTLFASLNFELLSLNYASLLLGAPFLDCSLEILSRQKAGATVGSSCSFLRCHAHGYIRALLRKNMLKGTSRTCAYRPEAWGIWPHGGRWKTSSVCSGQAESGEPWVMLTYEGAVSKSR